MSMRSLDYAWLADHSYKAPERDPVDPTKYRHVVLSGVTYEPLMHIHRRSGYQGTLYQRHDTGALIVAHRGTEFDAQFLRDLVATDGAMVLARANPQAKDAIELTARALERARTIEQRTGQAPTVTVTGHSLGGTLAQITAHHFALRGETFNAYGAAGLGYRIPAGGDAVTNHVMAADGVSAASPHYGRVVRYALPEEVQALRRHGYGNDRNPFDQRNLIGAFVERVHASHSMHHFLDVGAHGRPDRSVLADPETRRLADAQAPLFDKFRGDVAFAREAVTRGARGAAGMLADRLDQIRGPIPPGEPARRTSPRAPQVREPVRHRDTGLFGDGGIFTLPDFVPRPPRRDVPMTLLRNDGIGQGERCGRDDPPALVQRLLAAAGSGDDAAFRQALRAAADHDAGRALRAEAMATLDAMEALATRHAATQPAVMPETQDPVRARSAPRMR